MHFLEEELELLVRLGIEPNLVLDGRRLRTKDYKEKAKNEGFKAIKSSDPCRKGHYIKSRSGHCLMCKPVTQAHRSRYYEKNYLYLLRSRKDGYIKCGITNNLNRRIKQINDYAYGGTKDWTKIASAKVKNSGRAENNVKNLLKEYKVNTTYTKSNTTNNTNEVFNAPESIALDGFLSVIRDKTFDATNIALIKVAYETRPSNYITQKKKSSIKNKSTNSYRQPKHAKTPRATPKKNETVAPTSSPISVQRKNHSNETLNNVESDEIGNLEVDKRAKSKSTVKGIQSTINNVTTSPKADVALSSKNKEQSQEGKKGWVYYLIAFIIFKLIVLLLKELSKV